MIRVTAKERDIPYPEIFITSALIQDPKSVTSDPSFEEIGGTVSNPSKVFPDLTSVRARVVGMVKSTGTGGELKLVEEDFTTPVDLNATPFAVPDTAGAWQTFSFDTDVQCRASRNLYCLMGRLNGATAIELKYVQVTPFLV